MSQHARIASLEQRAAQLREEIRRLGRTGIPMGYTNSSIYVPLFWLSSSATGRLAAARAIRDAGIHQVDVVEEVRTGLARLNLHSPQELLEWLRLYFPERGGLFQQPAEGLSAMHRLLKEECGFVEEGAGTNVMGLALTNWPAQTAC